MPRKKKQPEPEPPARMAYAIDYRGFDDDVLTFVFLSPIEKPLFEVFRLLCKGGYIMRGCDVEHEHAWQWRNGKAYWRWVFTPIDYHPEMLSLDGVRDFIERHLTSQGHRVDYYKDINKFLNL
jgi:hypothetical protein